MHCKKAKWETHLGFLTDTSNGQQAYINFISTTEDIDSYVDLFTMSIADSVKRSVPKNCPRNNFFRSPNHVLNFIKIRYIYRSQ